MSKWTPGPWAWRGGDELRTLDSRGQYQFGNVVLYYNTEDGIICSDEDRDFIAAAPDLYSELADLLGVLDALSVAMPILNTSLALRASCDAARLALAKARGEDR